MASINTNMASINAQSNLANTQKAIQSSLSKLSSGYRITKASDDAAGLAISEKMKGQISGLKQAASNAQSAISLIQTGEGGLSATQSILQRMRELAVQAASDTNTSDDRSKIQAEVDQLAKEITRISNTTEFNTQNLLAGGLDNTFQIGANAGQNITLGVNAMDAQSLGVAGANTTTTFTPTNSLVTSLETTSSNLNGKYLNVSKVAAVQGAVSESNALGGAGTAGGTYTGASDVTFQVRVDGISGGGDVQSASYTTDGGTTWTNAAVTVTAGTSSVITLSDGATLTAAFDADNAISDTFTFTQSAGYLTFQIGSSTTGGTTTGTAVKAYSNQSSVSIGDSATNSTATVEFTYATVFAGATAGTYAATGGTFTAGDSDVITQTSTASTAATIGADGGVSTAATVQKGIDVSTQGSANNAITTIDNAINTVSTERSKLGALQNRLENTITNLGTSSQNLTSAQSNITDVDLAAEMSKFTQNQVLAQAGVAMLAQANQTPQTLLKLLQ